MIRYDTAMMTAASRTRIVEVRVLRCSVISIACRSQWAYFHIFTLFCGACLGYHIVLSYGTISYRTVVAYRFELDVNTVVDINDCGGR